MTRFIKSIERAFPWILLTPVILPVVIWGGLIYPYLVPKTLFFYAISLIAVGMFAILVAYGRPFFWSRLHKIETWIPATLLVLAYVASALGIDFYRSFWSLFMRGDGLLMLTCATASFYLISLSADRKFFERLLGATAVIGSLVALYGIWEWLLDGSRIGSLLGNAALFAGYLGLSLFATLAAAVPLSRVWKRVAYAGAALQVVAIVFSATRGTMLALGGALILYLMYLAWRGNGNLKIFSVVALGILVVSGGLFFAFRSELAKVPFAPIARIASISAADSDVASRLFIWKNMVGEIEKAPLLGVGAEHIDVLFNRFYDPTLISEQWFDRSHNAFLDYAAQYGIGGLLLYLALIGSFFVAARRFLHQGSGKNGKDGERYALLAVLLAVTYSVQNFFVFDTVSSFWLLLALLAAFLAMSGEDSPRVSLQVSSLMLPVAWTFATACLILVVPVSVRPALAAYNLSEAYKYALVDPAREIADISRGSALGTYGDVEYGYEAYSMYISQSTSLSGEARINAYRSASSILSANFNRYPYDAHTALFLAHVLSLAPPEVAVDTQLLSEVLSRVITLSPKRSEPWYLFMNLLLSQAKGLPQGPEKTAIYDKAITVFKQYVELVPTLALPHYVLAELYFANADRTNADAQAALGKQYYKSDKETARRAAGYYESVLDLKNAAFFLAEMVKLDPSNTAAISDLSKIQLYEQSQR